MSLHQGKGNLRQALSKLPFPALALLSPQTLGLEPTFNVLCPDAEAVTCTKNHVGVQWCVPSPASVPKELPLSSLQGNSPRAGVLGQGSPEGQPRAVLPRDSQPFKNGNLKFLRMVGVCLDPGPALTW